MCYTDNEDIFLNVCIAKLQRYTKKDVLGKWVKLPATKKDIKEIFAHIGLGKDFKYGKYKIIYYETSIEGLAKILNKHSTLSELNYLAGRLKGLNGEELQELQALIDVGGYIDNIEDIINLTYNLDKFTFIPNVLSYEALGEAHIIDYTFGSELENLKDYINYEKLGKDIALSNDGSITRFGYIFNNGVVLDRPYKGDNIPEDYEV